MGIARLNLADLFVPLQSLASRWMPTHRSRRGGGSGLRYVGIRPSFAARPGAAALPHAPASMQALRVVRTIDAQHPRHPSGQVLLSGRMADVCAELDRLAAIETANASLEAHQKH